MNNDTSVSGLKRQQYSVFYMSLVVIPLVIHIQLLRISTLNYYNRLNSFPDIKSREDFILPVPFILAVTNSLIQYFRCI